MIIIGVIADTHIIPGGKRQLPPPVFEAFAAVDLILHAGDLNSLQVVSDLEALAPVVAVHGNNDDWEVMQRLPSTRIVDIEGCRIGLVHGDRANPLAPGRHDTTAARALSHFEDADCVIFGHSHQPLTEWRPRSAGQSPVLIFNPGSATQRRAAPQHSCGRVRVHSGRIEAELISW